MDRAHARALELRFQAEIEIRRIDADEQPRLRPQEPAAQPVPDTHELRQVREHFHIAAQRELRHRVPGFAPGRNHLRPRDSREARGRQPPAHRADQVRPERIP